MCPQDMRHPVDAQKLSHDLASKRISSSPRTNREILLFRIRIAPHQIRHRSFVRDLSKPVDDFDLVDGVDRGRKASVYTKDSIVDDDGESEVVEHIGEVGPYARRAVFPNTLGVEAICLGYRSGFVVPSDQVDPRRMSEFETGQEGDGLDAEEPSVDVIAWRGSERGRIV